MSVRKIFPRWCSISAAQIVKQNGLERDHVQRRKRLQVLQAHPWPGNIRELRNVVERLLLFAEGDTVTRGNGAGGAAGAGGVAAEASAFAGTRHAGRARGAV